MSNFFRLLCCMGPRDTDPERLPPKVCKDNRTRAYFRKEAIIACEEEESSAPGVDHQLLREEKWRRMDKRIEDHAHWPNYLSLIEGKIEEEQFQEREWKKNRPGQEWPLKRENWDQMKARQDREMMVRKGRKLVQNNEQREEREKGDVDEQILSYMLEAMSTTDRTADMEKWQKYVEKFEPQLCTEGNGVTEKRLETNNGGPGPYAGLQNTDYGEPFGLIPYHLPRRNWSHTADSGNTVAGEDFNTRAKLRETIRERLEDMKQGHLIESPRDRVDEILKKHAQFHILNQSQPRRDQVASECSAGSHQTFQSAPSHRGRNMDFEVDAMNRRIRRHHDWSVSANESNQTVDWIRRVRENLMSDHRGSHHRGDTDIDITPVVQHKPISGNLFPSHQPEGSGGSITSEYQLAPVNRKGKQRAHSSNQDSF